MRLPKNPRQYYNSESGAWRVSDEDFHKVVWSILNNQYRTVKKLPLPAVDLRKVRLPDDSEFRVITYWQLKINGDKSKFEKICMIEKEEGNYRPLD